MFTRFVNMLMSDVTYLLDESLSKLSEIHQIQLEMEDTAAWEAQPVVTFHGLPFVYKTMNSPSCMYSNNDKSGKAICDLWNVKHSRMSH